MTTVLDTAAVHAPERRLPGPVIIGSSAAMREVLGAAVRVAASSAPVLIQGETGTGKELIARLLHHRGPRRARPFVCHNCGATPDTLIESELFGHARGAYTGALRDRPGLFETAAGGSLFLDEIGEVSALMQVKLLRVLQEGEYRRLGETRCRQVDVRLVAATNRRLDEAVRSGDFRADLYYRLNVVAIEVPPLRQRAGDVAEIAEHLRLSIAAEEDRPPIRLEPDAVRALTRYPWPGNVRELENELRRLSALWPGESIGVGRLSRRVRTALMAGAPSPAVRPARDLREAVVALERRMIAAALVTSGGNKSRTARELGLSRQGLAKKMRRYGMQWLGSDDVTDDATGRDATGGGGVAGGPGDDGVAGGPGDDGVAGGRCEAHRPGAGPARHEADAGTVAPPAGSG
ncbi:MAG: sigma 54-interacting transcriptional regulator [Candidatus Eiseniibacteriota bacterium]